MPSRRAGLLALGAWLATRGVLPVVGLVVTGLAGLGCGGAALVLGRGRAPYLPGIAAVAVAWGGGMMLAFGAALRAVPRDREEGILALAVARGASVTAYVRGRVGGLVAVLAVAVGGATLVACLGAIAAGGGGGQVVRASVGALAYALAFAVTLGPVALATLGGRTRIGGYLALVAVVAVPEALAPWTATALPHGWRELTSIPAALAAVRDGVGAPAAGAGHAARAALGLAVVVAVALLAVAGRTRAALSAPAEAPR